MERLLVLIRITAVAIPLAFVLVCGVNVTFAPSVFASRMDRTVIRGNRIAFWSTLLVTIGRLVRRRVGDFG